MRFNLKKKIDYLKAEGYSMRKIQWFMWPEIQAASQFITIGEVRELFPEMSALLKSSDVFISDNSIIL